MNFDEVVARVADAMQREDDLALYVPPVDGYWRALAAAAMREYNLIKVEQLSLCGWDEDDAW